MPLRSATPGARNAALAFAAATGAAAMAAVLALPAEGLSSSPIHFTWIALASLAVTAALVLRTGLWTATGAYVAVFWCFHFGLVAVLGSGLVSPMDLSLWDQAWMLGPFGSDAALMALVGLLAFACGASVVDGLKIRRAVAVEPCTDHGAHAYGPVGSVTVLLCVGGWFLAVLSTTGVAGLFGSYGEYLSATADLGGWLAALWLALGCGLVMAASGARGHLRTAAFWAFGLMSAVALPLGLRGEIMFPTVAALVASARCGWTLTPRKAGVFVVAVLVMIPVIREVRHTGLQGLPHMVLDVRMFDAFVEMGGSLHPVEKVMRWHAEGEPLDLGASYWAPIERAAARVIPGLHASAAEDDMRIMNVLVVDRVGAIGFSPIAEAYRNFGGVGVVIILALLGAGLAALDRIADRRMAVFAIAAVYVPLLVNVRNSFVSVPLQCALGVLFLAGLAFAGHMSGSIICRPYARPPYVRSQV